VRGAEREPKKLGEGFKKKESISHKRKRRGSHPEKIKWHVSWVVCQKTCNQHNEEEMRRVIRGGLTEPGVGGKALIDKKKKKKKRNIKVKQSSCTWRGGRRWGGGGASKPDRTNMGRQRSKSSSTSRLAIERMEKEGYQNDTLKLLRQWAKHWDKATDKLRRGQKNRK